MTTYTDLVATKYRLPPVVSAIISDPLLGLTGPGPCIQQPEPDPTPISIDQQGATTMQAHVTVLASDKKDAPSRSYIARVDTGADVCTVPSHVLDDLGYHFVHKSGFVIADGSHETRQTGYAWIEVAGRRAHVWCQRNQAHDGVLLSVGAMAQLRIAPDPHTGKWIDTSDPDKLAYI